MDLFFWRNVNEHNTWKRDEGGVGTVITENELRGITWQTFVVLPGTRCLFIDNGMSQGELEPGKYTSDSLYQRFTQLRLKSAIRMFTYDSGDIHIEYNTDRNFYTKENVKTGGKLSLVLKVDDGLLFHNNFLKAKTGIFKKDITEFARGEIDHILSGFIVRHSFEELYGNLELRRDLLNKLTSELRTTFSRIGVDLVHIPYFDYDEGPWQEAKDKSGELELARMQMKVEIDTRNLEYEKSRANAEIELREQLLSQEFDIKEAVARAKLEQDGAAAIEEVDQDKRLLGLKILSRETATEMQALNTEEEKLNFLNRLDEKRSLSEQQKFEIIRAIDESNQDHGLARDLFVNKAKLMNQQEFDLLHLRYRHELNVQGLKNNKEVQVLEQDLLRNGALNQGELDKIRISNDYDIDAVRLDLEKRRRIFDREQGIEDAKADRDIESTKIDTYKEMKEAKISVKAQEQLVDERAFDNLHRRELEKMKQMNEMGAVALAAMADGDERASMLANLARTQAFKGMSPDEILAASASDSPEIAKAFQEKYRLAAMQTEKMLAMKDQHVKDVKDMGVSAQQIMGTVETTRAANPVHTNVAMSPGMGGMGGMMAWPGMVGGMGNQQQPPQAAPPPQEAEKFCTKCGKKQPESAKFCNSCGYSFPGME